MLTLEAIYQLALKHNIRFTAHYAAAISSDLAPQKPQSLSLWFQGECVEAWHALMTQMTEVPVSLSGTRQVTGSGATDGRLFPGYVALLDEVNAIRAGIGLGRVYG